MLEKKEKEKTPETKKEEKKKEANPSRLSSPDTSKIFNKSIGFNLPNQQDEIQKLKKRYEKVKELQVLYG